MAGNAIERHAARVVGEGEHTIVLAHGFGSDQRAWRSVEEALRSAYRLILFDHAGAGKSDPSAYSPHRYKSLHSYAEDVLELLDELGVSEVFHVGHSMSGVIGLLAAIDEPKLFRKLVLVGASPRYLNDPATSYVGGFEQEVLDGIYEAMATNYQAWVGGYAPVAMGNPDRPELAQEFAASLGSLRPDIALSVARLIFQSDHRADLAKVHVPTVVVQSRNDVAVPQEVGRYLASHIAGAELELINAEGHFPHVAAPEQIIDVIRRSVG